MPAMTQPDALSTEHTPGRAETIFCRICGGEFDAAEWRASKVCPECESPKRQATQQDARATGAK